MAVAVAVKDEEDPVVAVAVKDEEDRGSGSSSSSKG